MDSFDVDLLDLLLDNNNELNDLCYFLEVAIVAVQLVPIVQLVDSKCSLS